MNKIRQPWMKQTLPNAFFCIELRLFNSWPSHYKENNSNIIQLAPNNNINLEVEKIEKISSHHNLIAFTYILKPWS